MPDQSEQIESLAAGNGFFLPVAFAVLSLNVGPAAALQVVLWTMGGLAALLCLAMAGLRVVAFVREAVGGRPPA